MLPLLRRTSAFRCFHNSSPKTWTREKTPLGSRKHQEVFVRFLCVAEAGGLNACCSTGRAAALADLTLSSVPAVDGWTGRQPRQVGLNETAASLQRRHQLLHHREEGTRRIHHLLSEAPVRLPVQKKDNR